MQRFTRTLLIWYRAHQRQLPWRTTRDPYRVWVAETMLQQTRVATAQRYYEPFLQQFPTVTRLAKAPLDRVLKAWEGLGYYARARHLHYAAQRITQHHDGVIPNRKRELLQLPGIGHYTAGAILSMAFGQDETVLDGNVRRVLCRILCIQENPRLPSVQRRLERRLKRLLPPREAGTFNQALMELGATICIPRTPHCTICPVEAFCEAKCRGVQHLLPVKAPRRALPHHEVAVGVIWKGRKLLIARRPPKGLLGGLWEFPGGKREAGESLEESLHRQVLEELGITIGVRQHLTTVRHGYSHFRVTLHAFECDWQKGRPNAPNGWAWVALRKLVDYPFPRANQKIMEVLFSRSPGGRGTRRRER
jgi:A/G-specific adenine glycosylase